MHAAENANELGTNAHVCINLMQNPTRGILTQLPRLEVFFESNCDLFVNSFSHSLVVVDWKEPPE